MVEAFFVLNTENQILEFELKGHSLYDIKGQDIVCAAISGQITLLELAFLGVLKDPASTFSKTGERISGFCSKNECTQVLMQSFLLALKAIEKKYKNNLTVKIQEKSKE